MRFELPFGSQIRSFCVRTLDLLSTCTVPAISAMQSSVGSASRDGTEWMDYGKPEPMRDPTIKIQAEGGDCSDGRTASMALPFLKLVSVLASHSLKAVRRPCIQLCVRRWSCTQVSPSWQVAAAPAGGDESYSRPSTYYYWTSTWCDRL